MTQTQDFNTLRNNALHKLNHDEVSALLMPFISLSKATEAESKSETLTQVADSYSRAIGRQPGLPTPLKFLGPLGEEWTEAEWTAYVSGRLESTADLHDLLDRLVWEGI